MKTANGQVKQRVTSQGNKRMAIPDEHFPEFCRRIGANGTAERMKLINQFAEEHPTVSVRQVTLKLGEITTKTVPGCITQPAEREKKAGRAFVFYLRPRYYKYLPPEERPADWEKYAALDEQAWQEEKKHAEDDADSKAASTTMASEAGDMDSKAPSEIAADDESSAASGGPKKKPKLEQ